MRYIETYEVRRMTHSQESRVSSSQDTVPPREENRSNMSAMVNDINSCLRGDVVSNNNLLKVEKMAATSNEDVKNSDSAYPWLASWGDSCTHALGCRSSKKLENLMKKFLGYTSSNVKECYTRPNRAAKLRKCINETLLFFHLYYQDFHEPGKHSTYLNLMTELVSMYVDMEIKAASRRKERVKKITTRLIASLYLFLGKSEDHILDAILKTKLITKHNRDVCLPVLGKVVNQAPSPVNEMAYIRYLLIFKLYKKIAQNAEKGKQQKAEEGRRINKLAVLKLKPPHNFVEKAKMFTNVLPKIPPKSKKNITHFFMQAKFNLRSACTAFVKSASEFHTILNGSASKELYSKSISMDLASKLECNAGASNSSASDIWSSIELKSLVESFPLRNLNCEKSDIIGISKKVKEKVKKKNKKNKGMKSKEKDLEKIRKKKLKKNKMLDSCGDTEPMLQNKLLDSKKGKKRCLKNDAAVISCESTDESVSLPEINPTADSMNRDLGVLSNLSSKGLKNLLTGPGSSYSSESQKVGSTGAILKQEKGNEKDVSDIIEVAAETSVSVSGCEHSSSTATPVPTFSSRSNICTVAPPPSHPYSSVSLPSSHTPSSHKMPSTSSSQVGPHPYMVQHHASSHSDHTSHHPKHNSESLTSSPTKSSVLTSNSPHVSTSSLPSPHRNLPNICSGLPAGFTPSVPPPPLGHPPPSQHNMKCKCLDCYNNHMQYLSGSHSTRYLEHSDVSASFQPPLPSSPAPLRPPLPRSPAPPLPPLPSTPAPTSSAFPMHSMSVPPPSLALFSTIPPPPPPPALTHHISGHSSLSGIPVRPGHPHSTHIPPTHIPSTHPPQSTPPPPVHPPPTPPPPPSIPPPPPPTPAPLATSTFSSPPFHYSQFSSLPVSHPPSTQAPSTSALISSAPSLNASSRNPSVIPVNVSSVNPPVSHTPPPRSRSISSPSPCTPSYAPTPPPSCTPTPPSPACTPPSSPLYSHTRVSHSPSLTPSSTPPLHSANFPSQSSHSRPSHSSALLSPSLTPTPPPPSVHPSNSPSPSHSPMQCSVTPPLPLHPSTVPSQSSTNVSTSATRSLVVTLPSSNVSSQSISPSSPSQSCAVVFSTYTPASPSPSPSLCCSVSPSPSRSPSPCHSPSPSRSPSPSQSSFRRSPSICRSSPSRSLSPSRSRTPLSSPVSRSQSPSTSPSPSYTPVCLSPHTPNPSPLCIPTPSSPLRNSTTPTSCTTVSSVQPSIPSSMNSPVSKQSKPTESCLSSSPVQSPVRARSNTPVQHTSLASTSSHSSVTNTVSITTVTTCTTLTTSVPTSTLSSRASSSPSVPSSSTPVHVSISCKSPSCSPIPSDVSSQTEVRADTINVTLSVASPSQNPSSASPLTPPIPTPCIVEQPSTTTLILDSSAKVTQSSVELHGMQNDNKSKGPCDSSPAILDPVPGIPCFTSVASSEDRIEEVVAEVEVQAEDTETEVEADTLVSQVVEESQESVLTGTNSEQPVCEEVNERLSKMKVSCDSAGESMFLVETEEVYSDECEEVEPDMCIKEKMFEERYSHTNSVIAPVGQRRNTVIASGGSSGSAENTNTLVTSQICKTEVQENEAIASCSVPEKDRLNAVSPRLNSDPLLVSRPIPNDSESKTVAYTCDSSIPSVSLIEGCSPANNEDLFQLPMDIGNLEETTSFVPGAARNDELLNEVITGNHLLFSLQNGFSIMALDVSARQEDPEPDSPAVEEFDERDRASISNLMMYFSGVHTADFSDFGRGRQDYVVPRDILESDEIEEETEDTSPMSSDPHDKSFNISNNSVVDLDNHEYSRRHTKGGKHPAPGLAPRRYIDDLEERDVSDASPSSNVENDSMFSQNTLFSNDCIESRRDRHCHVPESPKMNALGEVHIPHSSTPKRLPDVNFIRSMPNTLDSREDSSPEESPVKVSESSSSALSRAHLLANRTVEVRLNRDSVPGIIPDVVLDAHKAEGQREQEAPKAAPRGHKNYSRRNTRASSSSKPKTRANAIGRKRGGGGRGGGQKAPAASRGRPKTTKASDAKDEVTIVPLRRSERNFLKSTS